MIYIRAWFDYFKHNSEVVYFDNAATSLKLNTVSQEEFNFEQKINASTHSPHNFNGIKGLEGIAKTRRLTKEFINAKDEEEIIFTSGATFSLNTAIFGVASTLKENDEVLTTLLEHSSTLIPILEAKKRYKLNVKYMDLDKTGKIDLKKIASKVTKKTKLVCFASVSNTVSVLNDIKEIIKEIRKVSPSAAVLIDAAQSIAHCPTDVQNWDCDFLAFSAHKMHGPFGVGVLYGKKEWLEKIQPLTYGGGAVYENDDLDYKIATGVDKFEAGTLNMAGIYAFSKAFDFFKEWTPEKVCKLEAMLKEKLREKIREHSLEKEYNFFGLENDGPILLIDTKEISPHDFITFLYKKYNIYARSGRHCANASAKFTHLVNPTVRISFGVYNDYKDIDRLITALLDKNSWINYII